MNRLNQDNNLSSPSKKSKLSQDDQLSETSNSITSSFYNELINDSLNFFDFDSDSIDLIQDLDFTFFFKIKGKVINKSSIIITRTDNKFFTFTVKDQTGEIKVKAFDPECSRMYNKIKLNSFLTIQNGRTQLVDKTYNSTNHNYEIILTENTIISNIDDQLDLPSIEYNFIDFNQLSKMDKDKMIDVIGIVYKIDQLTTYKNTETNVEGKKRDVHLIDDTKNQIVLTLWNDHCDCNLKIDDIIVLRKVKISNFYGLSLSLLFDTKIEINPNLDQVIKLKNWFNDYKHSLVAQNLTELSNSKSNYNLDNLSLIYFDYVKDKEKLFTNAKATILKIDKPNIYKACKLCNKKLNFISTGSYSCSKCDKITKQFKWCMLLKVFISDYTNSIWVKLFNREMESILNDISIDDLGKYWEANNFNKIDDILHGLLLFKNFIFELKSTIHEFYGNESLETIAIGIDNLNLINYGKMIVKKVKNLNF